MPDHAAIDHTGLTGAGSPTEITGIPTAEMDDTLVLAPDGAGGVEFRAEAGGASKAHAVQIDTSGNHHITTTSFADVDATNLGLSITTAAGAALLVGWSGSCSSNGTNYLCLDISVDGTLISGGSTLGIVEFNTSGVIPVSFQGIVTGLSAGAHTVRLSAKMNGAGAGDIGQTTSLVSILTAIEL